MDLQKLLAQHPSFTHAADIKQLTKPLSELGITYFSHARVDKNGFIGGHASSPELLAYYYENNYHHHDIHLVNPLEMPNYILWDYCERSGKTAELYELGGNFGVYHTFSVIRRGDEATNYYHFAVERGNSHMNAFYVQNLDLLDKFIDYYEHHLQQSKLLFSAFDFAFEPDLSQGGFKGKCETLMTLNSQQRSDFLASIKYQSTPSEYEMLSPRELECLTLLAHGNPVKQIASCLGLQPKTVYFYLDNIKKKIDCHSRTALANFYWRHQT